MGTCAQFMAAWASKYEYCCNCIYWDYDDLICMDSAEIARRRRARSTDSTDKMMRQNKPVYLE